ncbi:DUF6126 family protein [Streptomyces sparsogenes]|uniref:DUF6126 family protein n=1 Tax=Streptomyces sparsogenes TaxID=67365 RepID=UPI00340E1453
MTDADSTPATGATGNAARGEPLQEEDRAPMAFSVRVFIYLVGVHFIAAFLFLLFYLGGAK